MKIGDVVICMMPGFLATGEFIVIGEMKYSNGDKFLIADYKAIGMPCHISHLCEIGVVDVELAFEYRGRYEAKFPNQLKELQDA